MEFASMKLKAMSDGFVDDRCYVRVNISLKQTSGPKPLLFLRLTLPGLIGTAVVRRSRETGEVTIDALLGSNVVGRGSVIKVNRLPLNGYHNHPLTQFDTFIIDCAIALTINMMLELIFGSGEANRS
jgi:hypothetical protein